MRNRPVLLGLCMMTAMLWPLDLKPPLRWHTEEWPTKADDELSLVCLQIIRDSSLYTEGWDTLSQPEFWRSAMHLSPETVLVNLAKTRQIVDTLPLRNWQRRSDRSKKAYEDSVRQVYGLGKKDEIYFTTGRNHFYRYEPILRHIDQALGFFAEEGVDPWFAQAILLIESPGRLQYSTDGAYGAFQLMKGVAREMGLVVNDTVDEREDFESSARGAARLIKTVCLPHTRSILDKAGIEYKEDETWFKLLVLHVYHAGARNVSRVIKEMKPTKGGMQLITDLWQSKSRRFGNASQNYSQIILAAFMEIDVLLETTGIVCPAAMVPNPDHGRVPPAAMDKATASSYSF
ncbi:MAG: hypothetical protein NWR72_20820 [Bacteroidia bacterium]|nr:hypothetical protein [Bacteroidia bacterium]